MAQTISGGKMTVAKVIAAKTPTEKGLIKNRPAGRKIMARNKQNDGLMLDATRLRNQDLRREGRPQGGETNAQQYA